MKTSSLKFHPSILILLTHISLLLFTLQAFAENSNIFNISTSMEPTNLNTYFQVIHDKKGKLSFDEAKTLFEQSPKQLLEQISITELSAHNIYWLRFSYQSKPKQNHQDEHQVQQWILGFSYPEFPDMTLYRKESSGQFSKHTLSKSNSIFLNEIQYRSPAFYIKPEYETKTLYIRVNHQGFGATLLPALWPSKIFDEQNKKEILILGGSLFILLAMAIYNLFIYWAIRDVVYLSYSAYIGGMFLVGAYYTRFAHQFFPIFEATDFHYWGHIFSSFAAIAGGLFTISFLELKERMPHKTTLFYIAFSGLILLDLTNTFYGIHPISYLIFILLSLSLVILMTISAIESAFKKYRPAYYYLFAWVGLLSTSGYFTVTALSAHSGNLANRGLSDSSFYIFVGAAVEAVLLSVALAYKIKAIRHERDKAKNELIERLQQTNRIKDQFLTNVSHELRTPMNGITLSADLLAESNLDDEQKTLVGVAISASSRMSETLENILSYIDLKSNTVILDNKIFNPEASLKSLRTHYIGRALTKGLYFNLSFERGIPKLYGDVIRFEQIIEQLIINAIRFTKKGGIDVSVEKGNKTENVLHLCLKISDTGPGIDSAIAEKIFELFRQGDESSTRENEGLGLGLAIVVGMTKQMRGSLALMPNEFGGSCFSLAIPFQIAEVNTIAQDEMIRQKDNISCIQSAAKKRALAEINNKLQVSEPGTIKTENIPLRKVLIVEDNPSNQIILKKLLKKLNFEVSLAENGSIGVQKALDTDFDVILMDCQMPIMDGYEATSTLRLTDKTRQTPIIAVTANAHSSDKKRCLEAGMNDYLKKPVNIAQLKEKLAIWCPLTLAPSEHPKSSS